MENEEISKYLTEKMGLYKEPKWKVNLNKEWWVKNPVFRGTKEECEKYCERHKRKHYGGTIKEIVQSKSTAINLFSPEGFFILKDWAIKQDWWKDFWYNKNRSITINKPDIIDYKTFPIKIYHYLKESE